MVKVRNMAKKNKLAIMYDFDKTLSTNNMQEYVFIPEIEKKREKGYNFWNKVTAMRKENNADEILTYMYYMMYEANSCGLEFNKNGFKQYATTIKFFEGVETWFDRINEYGKQKNIIIEHYIISSGIKEIIQETSIASKFKEIYACSYIYDVNNKAVSPGVAINYTNKTQYIFRINKGELDASDNSKINAYVPEEERYIPFTNMIYIGDGDTDIPAMKLTKHYGGHSIAVFRNRDKKSKKTVQDLLKYNRVNFICQADYSQNKDIDKIVKSIIDKIVADISKNKLQKDLNVKYTKQNKE